MTDKASAPNRGLGRRDRLVGRLWSEAASPAPDGAAYTRET